MVVIHSTLIEMMLQDFGWTHLQDANNTLIQLYREVTYILTTRTDYVNQHPSIIQTTSYNFTGTNTTTEVCVGIVKAHPIHEKNTVQHYCDLVMLAEMDSLNAVFCNQETKCSKGIDCIRVDGASDEGPSHEAVQYWWTEWHINQSKLATLVATRSSGSSYLNRVELQNGCLSLGHSNTFIPSTLGGSCTDPNTGRLNKDKLVENLELAISAYISRVDGCPCGETNIKLFRGSDSTRYQKINDSLRIFLKGSKKLKQSLQLKDPELFSHFEQVWEVRNRHMVKGLPASYVFYLRCCYQTDCIHPRCSSGENTLSNWYPDGPALKYLPLPIPDPQRPWGNPSCNDCKGICNGHYITELINTTNAEDLRKAMNPPLVVLKNHFPKGDAEISEKFIEDAAKKCLLTTEEVQIWLNHLREVERNRKIGVANAAETRKKKDARKEKNIQAVLNQDDANYGTCGIGYTEDVGLLVINVSNGTVLLVRG